MGKVMTIYCDSCKREIGKPYQTLTVRRYTKNGQAVRFGTIWLCDPCYKKMVVKMALPPYDEERSETSCNTTGSSGESRERKDQP